MYEILLTLILSTIGVFVAGNILSGVRISNLSTALIVAVILGIINVTLKPILLILTIPFNILTLGLFTFVVMGFCAWLTSKIVPGFYLANFWWAMGFAIVLAIINSFLNALV